MNDPCRFQFSILSMCSFTNPRTIEAIRGSNFGRIETNKYLAITFCPINQDFDPCDITGQSAMVQGLDSKPLELF